MLSLARGLQILSCLFPRSSMFQDWPEEALSGRPDWP
jgi:hypothetical protein